MKITSLITGFAVAAAITTNPAIAGPAKPAKPVASATATAPVPAALIAAAKATRSDRTGNIAAAQIPGTQFYVVYIETQRGCGSGGCRAQIWKQNGTRFERHEGLVAGYLPIVLLPTKTAGMPDIGITVFGSKNAMAIMPVKFNGTTYPADWSDTELPANAGRPLLTDGSLKPY